MVQIDQISTKDPRYSLDNFFTKQRNITDRHTILITQREPVEKFYGCLRELSLNCDLGSHKESIIWDVFIANMQKGEIQREMLKETRTAKKALELAINIEMGIQNQLNISGCKLYLHSTWRNLHVLSGCVCVDKRVAIPNSIQDAALESLQPTHPGSCGMITIIERLSANDHRAIG